MSLSAGRSAPEAGQFHAPYPVPARKRLSQKDKQVGIHSKPSSPRKRRSTAHDGLPQFHTLSLIILIILILIVCCGAPFQRSSLGSMRTSLPFYFPKSVAGSWKVPDLCFISIRLKMDIQTHWLTMSKTVSLTETVTRTTTVFYTLQPTPGRLWR